MGTHSGYQPLVTGLGTHKAETSFAYCSRAASNKEKKIEKRIGTYSGYPVWVPSYGNWSGYPQCQGLICIWQLGHVKKKKAKKMSTNSG